MVGNLTLVNGNILTMDPDRPRVSALAVRNGRIVAVGADADVRAESSAGTEVIDLHGRSASPGLNDAHAHPMAVGFALGDLDFSPERCGSIANMRERIQAAAADRPRGAWIMSRGYDQARLAERRHPTRHDLDDIAPDHPVLLIRACHHIGVANSAALALAGIDAGTDDPEGGEIDRDERGQPTGVLRETAFAILRAAAGEPSEDDIAEALIRGGRAFLASGVTSAVEAGIDRPEELRAYQRLERTGLLPVRTYLMMMIEENLDRMIELGVQTGLGNPWLRIGPAKLFSDGSIGGHTARMRQPYQGTADTLGLWMQEPDEIKRRIRQAHDAGFQVGIHAIGDAAIELILDGYEEAMTASPRPDPRHRIEHCSIVDEAIIERIARLRVIPIPGTSFLYHFRDAYLDNLGMDRLRYAYGMASFARYGVIAAASTDAPVVPENAMIGLQTMMTRRDATGEPIWPEEGIDLLSALRAYTVNGAYASFEESIKGALRPGMLGDITVYDADLEDLAPEEIGQVSIDATIVEGKIAYARGD